MEISCEVCFHGFSISTPERRARVLPCGHSFCTGCVRNFGFSCPECRRVFAASVDFLPFNFTLERILGGAASGSSRAPLTAVASTVSPPAVEPPTLPETVPTSHVDASALEARLVTAEVEIEQLKAQLDSLSAPLEWARAKFTSEMVARTATERRERELEAQQQATPAPMVARNPAPAQYWVSDSTDEESASETESNENGWQRNPRNICETATAYVDRIGRAVASPQLMEYLRQQRVWPPADEYDYSPFAEGLWDLILEHREMGELRMYKFGSRRRPKRFYSPAHVDIVFNHQNEANLEDYGSGMVM